MSHRYNFTTHNRPCWIISYRGIDFIASLSADDLITIFWATGTHLREGQATQIHLLSASFNNSITYGKIHISDTKI